MDARSSKWSPGNRSKVRPPDLAGLFPGVDENQNEPENGCVDGERLLREGMPQMGEQSFRVSSIQPVSKKKSDLPIAPLAFFLGSFID
jgi:hypothetical protein